MTQGLGGFDPKLTYDDASADYENACREFWGYMAARAVDRLDLRTGDRVLDVPCGTGTSLLTLAERVGPSGRVVGLDYAERMVEIARAKVHAAGLDNVELRTGDMTAIVADEPYDAVLCALGLFFVDDMPALVRSFLHLVRPAAGRVAVTVFGERFFEPMRTVFVSAVRDASPGCVVVEPWRRTESAVVLHDVFRRAGAEDVEIVTEDDVLPLASPDDWWRIVMGSGLRRTVTTLGDEAAAEVRRRCDAYIEEHGITALTNRTRHAVAVRG